MENKVLAVVDGREITQMNLFHLLQSIGQEASRFQGEDGQKQLIDELVLQELLYSDALAQGLEKDAQYQEAVAEMEKSLLKQYALKKLMDAVEATEEEIKDYYDHHTSLFTAQPKATASHILVDTEEEALKIAEEIKNGLDFAEAARQYSKCPSKNQGGSLGSFTHGQMVPQFEMAAFAMEPGTISEPVHTQFGYHLIKLEALTKASVQPYETVKAQVKEQLLLAKRQARLIEKREALEKQYDIKIMA